MIVASTILADLSDKTRNLLSANVQPLKPDSCQAAEID